MKKTLAVIMAALLVFGLCACAQENMKISFISGTGGAFSDSFNQNAWKAVSEYGRANEIETQLYDSFNDAAMQSFFDETDSQKSGLVIAMGDSAKGYVEEHAKNNPKTSYALIDGSESELDNVMTVSFRQNEVAFLAGYLAANLSKTGTVGFVGGEESVVIAQFENGYKAGVEYANNGAECLSEYVGDFNDPVAGKKIADGMLANGADVIYHAAGQSGSGVIDTVKDNGKYAIGVDDDQSYLAPNNVCASTVKDTGVVARDICEMAEASFPETISGNLSIGISEGLYMVYNEGIVSEELQSQISEIQSKIIAGEIAVPATAEELAAF